MHIQNVTVLDNTFPTLLSQYLWPNWKWQWRPHTHGKLIHISAAQAQFIFPTGDKNRCLGAMGFLNCAFLFPVFTQWMESWSISIKMVYRFTTYSIPKGIIRYGSEVCVAKNPKSSGVRVFLPLVGSTRENRLKVSDHIMARAAPMMTTIRPPSFPLQVCKSPAPNLWDVQ